MLSKAQINFLELLPLNTWVTIPERVHCSSIRVLISAGFLEAIEFDTPVSIAVEDVDSGYVKIRLIHYTKANPPALGFYWPRFLKKTSESYRADIENLQSIVDVLRNEVSELRSKIED